MAFRQLLDIGVQRIASEDLAGHVRPRLEGVDEVAGRDADVLCARRTDRDEGVAEPVPDTASDRIVVGIAKPVRVIGANGWGRSALGAAFSNHFEGVAERVFCMCRCGKCEGREDGY